MNTPTEEPPSGGDILILVLEFLKSDAETQIATLNKYNEEVKFKGYGPHVQHPLIELSEFPLKIPWSLETPEELVQLLEELEALTGLMWSDKWIDYTAEKAVSETPAWRLVRRISRDALAVCPRKESRIQITFWDLMCHVSD